MAGGGDQEMCAPIEAKLLTQMPAVSSTDTAQPRSWRDTLSPPASCRAGRAVPWLVGRARTLGGVAASCLQHAHVATSWVCATLILQHLLAFLKSPDPIRSHLQIPSPDPIPGQSKDKKKISDFPSPFAGYFFGKMQLRKERDFSWRQKKCSFQVSIRFEFPQEK